MAGLPLCQNTSVFNHVLEQFKKLTVWKIGAPRRQPSLKSANFGRFEFPLVGGQNIQKLILNIQDQRTLSFWHWIFKSFPNVKNLHINGVESTWMGAVLPDEVWTIIRREGKSVRKMRITGLRGLKKKEFQMFMQKVKLHLLKINETVDLSNVRIPVVIRHLK